MSFKKALLMTAALSLPMAACSTGESQPTGDTRETITTVTPTTVEAAGKLSVATCGILESAQSQFGEQGTSTVKLYAGKNQSGEIEYFGEITYQGREMREDSEELMNSVTSDGIIPDQASSHDAIAASGTMRVAAEATDTFTIDMDPPIDEAYNEQQFDELIGLQDQARQEIDRALANC